MSLQQRARTFGITGDAKPEDLPVLFLRLIEVVGRSTPIFEISESDWKP